ncbi:MAG: type II toxin-antitoxin system prevent-host-death family antitoxin [Deltaproteobacteria bacterium]|nr:type II toxin-antitoxin system prevent-host-death family antitoxin [Deltaproteobacteria bacterium]
MNTIPAQEIKRRGISVVDEVLKDGPVHVIKNNQPRYVVISEEHYRELVSAGDEAYVTRIKASLEDVKAGRVKKFKKVDDLLKTVEKEAE